MRSDTRRTYLAILDSARSVLAADPKATVAEIADHAGVHRATLHRHFPSREALVEQLALASMDALEHRIAALDVETVDARTAIQRATLAWMQEGRSNWRMSRYTPLHAVPASGARDRLRARMLAVFERGQRDGSIRTDQPAPTLYAAWTALVFSWNAFYDSEPEEMAATVMGVLFPERDIV